MNEYHLQWKYVDKERDLQARAKCYDCALPYPQGNDCVIPNDIWEQINPTYHVGAGILCANCIMARLEFLGICGVNAILW